MQRQLLARECGDEVPGIDDVLSARWTCLQPQPPTQVTFAGDLTFAAHDTPTGRLLLTGSDASECNNIGILLAYPPYKQVGTGAGNTATSGAFLPDDPGLFMTGGSLGVQAWDACRLQPAAQFDTGAAHGLAVCGAPRGRRDVVAIAGNGIVLLDLRSGAAVQRLSVRRSGVVLDVDWAPRNGNMVAGIAGGMGSMFDVRMGRKGRLMNFGDWNDVSFSQMRYGPRGGDIVTLDNRGRFCMWDVHTGKMERTFVNGFAGGVKEWKRLFEITPDGAHLICNNHGGIESVDAEDGGRVNLATGRWYDMHGMAIHPVEETVTSVYKGWITRWESEKTKDKDGGERGV